LHADDSILKVTNSILRSEVIGAGDRSTVEISNSQLAGELQMRSVGSMTLSVVTPFQRPSEAPNLRLIAEDGKTEISSSTLLSVTSRGRASVTVTTSTIRDRVSHDRIRLDASLVPTTTLAETQVGSLSASIGAIRMTGGRVKGVVQASGALDDPLRAGSIFVDRHRGGSVSHRSRKVTPCERRSAAGRGAPQRPRHRQYLRKRCFLKRRRSGAG
jgi:hypothetical protein